MMEHKSDLEKAKKVYRAAVDAVKKLDESLKKKKAYREVFSQDAVGLRYKLREYCERLMFYNPLYYGRKAEEVLWRKVFYDIIQLIKRNRRHVRVGSSLETAYRTHLSAACGYYYHLLFRLQKDFNLKLNMKIDFPLLPDNNPSRYIKAVRKKEVTTAMKEWALKTVHRCLVCLGDIARYQHDFDAGMNIVAESLSSEVPFEGAEGNLLRLFEKNQKRYQELTADTARTSQNPHEQCYNDLKAFFIQFMNLLKIFYRYDVPASQQDNHEIQECCQATLNSFNQCMFYEPTTYSADLAEENLHFLEDDVVFKIVVMCTSTIHILQNRGSRKVTAATAFLLALFSHILNHVVIRLQGALYERENPNKILQANTHNYDGINGEDSESDSKCSLKLHTRMRRRRRPKASKVDSDSDLSDMSDLSEGEAAMREEISDDSEEEPLGFYNDDSDSELSDSLMKSQDLEPGFAAGPGADSVPPPGAPDDMFPIPEITAPNHKPTENLAPGFGAPSSDTNKMWPLSHSDSLATFSSELFSSSVPFLSSNFKLSQPTEGVDNDVIMGKKQVSVPPGFHTSSEAKHVAEISQKLANFVIETDTEASITATEIDSDGEEDTPQSSEDTEKARSSSEEEREGARVQHVLEVIQGEGLMPAVKSSQSVWCRLSVLLNFLPHESTITEHAECWSDDVRVGVVGGGEGGWSQTLPLPEDIHLTRFPPLSHAHKDLPRKTSVKMSEQQESFLRTRCLRQFGHFLSGLKGLNFSYNEEKGIFIGPAPPISTEETQEDAMEKMVDAESRRNQLMRDMAQLRLQAEVSQLEGNLSQPETAPFPPYVIPDATSLCTALPNVRRLAQSNRTIIVIPLAVIDSLDIQKKESHGAREAIRWLEAEFRKGNRYIRAQKNSEKLQTAVPKHLKKKNRDTWCALEIFNCALYLSRQGGDFGADTVIAVLTATKFSHLTHPLVKQTIASSEQEGVSVENVTEFMAKWSEDLNKR
ncbi:SMG5-like protein [Mya arenaria]|uniref:SMG5-like protein n=1 Tax=Mya arenaria TaxID=6604 RepID=A0ABY7DVK4_MYAAR|nr:SMG5-like protein [Mya arenaria]